MQQQSRHRGRSGAAAIGRAAAIVAASLDCIISIDESGRVVEFNPAAERVFGWSRAEALGRSLHELIIPEELRDAHRAGLAHLLATGEGPVLNQRLELPAVRKDGSRITVELTIAPTPGASAYEFTGFLRDITELRETQERLRRSEERYEAIAANSNRALILCGPADGESRFVTGERVLGYRAGTPLPGGFLSLVHAEDRAAARTFMEGVRAGERAPEDTVDLRLLTHEGGYLLCEVMGEDFRDTPAIGALMLRATDVERDRAQRRELSEATVRMRTLLDRMTMGVAFEDPEHRVQVVSRAMLDLFHVDADVAAFVGLPTQRAAESMTPFFDDPEEFLRGVVRVVEAGLEVTGEELQLADGRTLERDYIPLRGDDEGDLGHLWVYRDVSHRAEEARRLEEQNQSLAELAALKNEFVATVSHELRTPLTSVVSFAELLNDPSAGELNEEQQQFLDIVERNAHKLLRLIDDLLLVAKLEAHTLPMTPGRVDGSRIAADVATDLAPRAEAAEVEVEVSAAAPVWLEGDLVRLQQVVGNLLGNAISYTPAGGRVDVASRAEGDRWVLEVSDTGVGIPEAELTGVFDAFKRASTASSSSHHGTGLGLAICRLIVEQHGGTVAASSAVGEGTTMTVSIPREAG